MQNRILIGTIITVTILYWLVLLFEIDIFQFIPGYVWHFMQYSDKPLEYMGLLVPLAIVAYFVISYVLKKPEYHKRNLMLLVFLGYFIQMGFGFMEGRGIDGIRQRMVTTGHAEFARLASIETDMLKVASHYENMLDEVESLQFAKAKPPGHLLFYMLAEKMSNAISPSSDPRERFRALVTFASYLYPLLSYLVIIPLFYFGRLFMKKEEAILPCILYLFIPSVTLVTLHLDQVLYPLLFMTSMFFILYAFKEKNLAFSIIAGLFVYIAFYFSFSLLAIIPTGLLCAGTFIYSEDKNGWKQIINVRLFIGLVTGFLIGLLLFWLLLDYSIFVRYQNAMAFHQAWKGWDSNLANTVLYAVLNYIEFVCWLGLPLSILFFSKIRLSNSHSLKDLVTFENLFALSILLIFLLLGFFGRTKSEVCRLWIFMIPVVLIFISSELQKRFKAKINPALWFILTLQLISILFIKRFQDFW